MAALIIAKRTPAAASKLMEKLLFSAPPASPAAAIGGAKTASGPLAAVAPGGGRRAYNRRVEAREMTTTDEDEDRSVDADRRGEYGVSRRRRHRHREEDAPAFFSDFVDPFNPTRSLGQVLNMVDQFMDSPFTAPARVGSRRGGWDAREDADAVHIRVDMPGLGKEDVQVTAEQNTLVIKGEAKPDGEGEGERRYSTRIELAPELYKMGEIKAEMKNGVLKIVVPKVKEEERKDVVQIDVQ